MIRILSLTKQDIERYIYHYICVLSDLKDSFIEFIKTIFRTLIGAIFIICMPFVFLILNIINMKNKRVIRLTKENMELINSNLDSRLKANTFGTKIKYNLLIDEFINQIIKEYYNKK